MKDHDPSGSIIDKLTGRRGFLGAVLAGAAFVGATACGRSSGETKTGAEIGRASCRERV